MAMPLWIVRVIKKTFPGLFTAARLTRAPGIGRAIDYALFDGDAMMYLPKDGVIAVGREVDDPGSMVLPSKVVGHFIERANFLWIMNTCICRDASHCRDYPIDLGCLFLGEAAMRINPALGRPVSRDEAREHVRRCREAGLVHVIGRNKLDSAWLWVSPKEKLLTICNCCPCCCIWRMAPYLDPKISAKLTPMPGVELRVTDACEGCGTCVEQCFVQAIRLEDGRAVITEMCKGCGRCAEACPHGAIELKMDVARSVDSAVERIAPLVDIS
ncbi:MAG TPA: 4Fe-4S binding protein [bacterium]|nr:4Fe-4S binding protein [bacterium]